MARKSDLPEDLADMVRNWGFAFELLQKLAIAVAGLGGNLGHLRRLLSDTTLMLAVAQLLVGVPAAGAPVGTVLADHYRVFVNYVLPPIADLRKVFAFVSEIWDGREWKLHDSLKGLVQTPAELAFFLRHFGEKMSSEAVIAWAEANGYRVANHLEALAFAQANHELQRKFWYVALGSFALDGSKRYVAYLYGDTGYRGLDGYWFGRGWSAGAHFLLVRK